MEVVLLSQQAKHALVGEHARGYRVLVETGLWNGGGASTTLADSRRDLTCYAIDLSMANVDAAARRGVLAYYGSSARVLPLLLRNLSEPACFWLDAHLATEGDEALAANPCPLLDELQAILRWPHAAASAVLIDDLRLMGSTGWPSRMELYDRLADCPWIVNEADDVLRLTPLSL